VQVLVESLPPLHIAISTAPTSLLLKWLPNQVVHTLKLQEDGDPKWARERRAANQPVVPGLEGVTVYPPFTEGFSAWWSLAALQQLRVRTSRKIASPSMHMHSPLPELLLWVTCPT
jgi:hypothetical protein